MKLLRGTLDLAAMLQGLLIASGALAAHGGGHSGGHGGGHSGGHAANFGGHGVHFAGRGFSAPVGVVPRRVFYAAPVAYFPPPYYYPRPVYYEPISYYEPAQSPVYYEPPVQSPIPSGAAYPPPPVQSPLPPRASDFAPSARQSSLSSDEPVQNSVYFCKDSSGRMIFTNRKEDMVGKNCRSQPVQTDNPVGGGHHPPPSSGLTPASPGGQYLAQDAFHYRYYCPDTRKYYPEVNECSLSWLKVVPEGIAARR